jgi:hypothetical protein
MNPRLIATLLLLIVSSVSQATPFAKGDAEAGKKSFEEHKCISCHIGIVGGNGSAMFTRPDHKIKSAASLATQITRCSNNLGLMLFEDDEENIGAYLNKNYYKFK